MFEDWFTGTRGTIEGTHDGVDYSFSFGEHATKWWLTVIAALIVGVILGRYGGVRIIR